MQDIIDYINKNHSGHSHLAIAVRVLRCLAYIEKHIKDIAAQAGVISLLRDPGTGLAFHIADYPTPDIAHDQLMKLVNEVRGALHDLMAIENDQLRHEVVSIFLNNINDANNGCMEARLRPALMFYALYQSSGCVDMHNLMHEFVRQHENQTLIDMLDYFSLRVEHQLPVRDHTGNIAPLTWDMIKHYYRTFMMWNDIEQFWREEAKTLTPPKLVTSRLGYFCNFDNESDATRQLALVKSVLPEYRAELSKAAVKYNEKLKVYSFWLSHLQYHALQSAYEATVSKDKEEVNSIPVTVNETKPIDASILFQDNCKAHPEGDDIKLIFENLPDAVNACQRLHSILNSSPVHDASSEVEPFAIIITKDQWQELRKTIRAQAKKFTLKGDFVIKSLRADELYFSVNLLKWLRLLIRSTH